MSRGSERVGRGCHEDARTTCPQQVVRIELVEFRKRHDTRTNGQYCTVTSGTGKSPNTPDTRDIFVASSRGCRRCRACPRGCHEDATRMPRAKLLPWNFSFTEHKSAPLWRHGKCAGQRPPLGSHGHCAANNNVIQSTKSRTKRDEIDRRFLQTLKESEGLCLRDCRQSPEIHKIFTSFTLLPLINITSSLC